MQLDRATRAARVFAECSHARIHARDEAHLLRELCRIVVDTGGYVQAYVGYASDDELKPVTPVAEAGFEPGYLARKPLTWSERPAEHVGMGDSNREALSRPRRCSPTPLALICALARSRGAFSR